jgi:peptide/nickel transport system substrate-binding protein
MRWLRDIGLGCVLLALLVTPALGQAVKGPRYGGTLVVALAYEPRFMNVNYEFDGAAPYYNMNIYSKVVNYDYPTNKVHGDLAERWDVSSDGLTYTFYLRRNVKWHDGRPFTSADVKWTLDSILAEGNKAQAYRLLSDIQSVSAPDPYTIRVRLKDRNSAFLMNMASYYGFNVLPRHLYEGTDVRTNPANLRPIGTGPFKFSEWVQGSHITFVANKEYFREGPYLDRLVFRTIPHMPTVLAALETAEIHFSAISPPFGEVDRLLKMPGVTVDPSSSMIMQWIAINMEDPKYKDPRVRQALAHAINPAELANRVYRGMAKPGLGTYTSAVQWAYNPKALQPKHDLQRAEQLLDEAGLRRGRDGVRFKTRYSAWIANIFGGPELAQVVREQLSRVGIDMTVEVSEFALFREKVQVRRDFELTGSGGLHGPDPSEFYNFVGCTGIRNVMKYCNQEVERLFDEGRKAITLEDRKKAYFRIQEILAVDVPRLNLVEYRYMRPYRKGFHGLWWQPSVAGRIGQDMYNLVWMDSGRPNP